MQEIVQSVTQALLKCKDFSCRTDEYLVAGGDVRHSTEKAFAKPGRNEKGNDGQMRHFSTMQSLLHEKKG